MTDGEHAIATNPLITLTGFGQSVWLDSISRDLVTSGRLRQLVEEDGLRGVTSNPAIFQKALASGAEYDAAIDTMISRNPSVSAGEIYEALAVEDIRMACDVLYPVHRATGGVDGFVSLEVSPYLAGDTGATIAEARRLHAAVARPNVYIKIPGTPAGVPAIETLIGEGIPINVTLLFAVPAYEEAARAYMRGLEHAVAAGRDITRIVSVASFFVSRIDTLVDERLKGEIERTTDGDRRRRLESLLGRAAIANAWNAWALYHELLASPEWRPLAARGARPQRVLWASTSTKNPAYPKTLYVDELIGPDTVNTMPMETLEEFRAHGNPRPTLVEDAERRLEEARGMLGALRDEAGIDIDEVGATLLAEGITKFSEPFDTLLATIEKKRQERLGNRFARQALSPGSAETGDAVRGAMAAWRKAGNVRRLWARDAGVWTGGDESRWLGWLGLTRGSRPDTAVLGPLAEEVRVEHTRHAALLGMGGSSLAPEVIARILGPRARGGAADAAAGSGAAAAAADSRPPVRLPELLVSDSTVPAQVRSIADRARPASSVFIVASKSGSTVEPNVMKKYFHARVEEAGTGAARAGGAGRAPGAGGAGGVGEPAGTPASASGAATDGPAGADLAAGRRFIAITDPGSSLEKMARAEGFRHIAPGLPSVGGRYSALSNFGMLPAALIGVDVDDFLARADLMVAACDASAPPEANPGVALGLFIGALARSGRDKLTFFMSPGLEALGAWLEQLLAESTGKRGRGIVPVDGEMPAAPAVYGSDRVFVYTRLAGDTGADEIETAVAALEKAGHPVARIVVNDAADLGAEFFRWEIATAVAGAVLEVNPFDQPDVEAAKVAARRLMEAIAEHGSLPPETPFANDAGFAFFADPAFAAATPPGAGAAAILRAHLARLAAGDYFAVQAWVEMNEANDRALQAIRHAVRDARRVATTVGYGPRFLHSTGQLHKGGPASGVFLQITSDDQADLPIPGERATFGMLKSAQARGDFDVLAERGRRILRVHLGSDVARDLPDLAARVMEAMR